MTYLQERWELIPSRARGFLTWAGVFALIVALKRGALLLPASWDESWAVLPGGLWLAENNFDIVGLVHQPPLFQYGPSTYALAPITWLTGVVAALTTTTKSFLVSLHLVHMAIGAIGLREVYRFARPAWSPAASVGLVVATALMPVMNAQLGFMYLEIPIFTAGMLAVNAGLAGKWGRAAAWGALATSFKASGILALAGVVAATYLNERKVASLRRAILVTAPSMAIGIMPVFLAENVAGFDRDLSTILVASATQLLRMPELALAIVLAVVFTVGRFSATSDTDRVAAIRLGTFAWLLAAFVVFYIFTASFVIRLFVLPRYFIILVPFALFAAWDTGRRRFGSTVSGVVAVSLVSAMVLNSSGSFMPGRATATSVGLESSNAYAERLLLTDTTLDAALSTGYPVYLAANAWFKTQYPDLGYVEVVPDNARLLIDLDPNNLPETFIIAETEADPIITDYLSALDSRPELSQISTDFSRDGFITRYITFRADSG